MSLRVIQISDLHLSGEYPLFLHNWSVLADVMADLAPDLVIVSGDLALAEPDRPADLIFARGRLDALAARLSVPVLAIPGNHDVGEGDADDSARNGEQKPVTSARVAQFRRLVGPDYWLHRIGKWTFLGINSQLLGTGLPEEVEQTRFIEAALKSDGGPHLVLVSHKPLYAPDDGAARWGRAIPEAESRHLKELLVATGARHVFCGHMHRYKRIADETLVQVWAPSAAFISTHADHDERGGEICVGMLCHSFHDSGVDSRLIDDPRLIISDIRLWNLPVGNALWTIVKEPSPFKLDQHGSRP